MEHVRERLRYVLLTGPHGEDFDARVSEALNEGYELYGSPALSFDGDRMVVSQAVILPAYAAGHYRRSDA